MRSLDIDDLPKHSEWARYLINPIGEPPSDPDAYTNVDEYDCMYEHLLEEYRQNPIDTNQFVQQIYAKGRDDPSPISEHENLYLTTPTELHRLAKSAVRDALEDVENTPETIVDLGCGYGSALRTIADTFPDATVLGGEYSPHGVELTRALHTDSDRIQVEEFDFYGSWDIFDYVSGDTLIFTRGTLTGLHEINEILEQFASRADEGNVIGGVHLEQANLHPETTLGLLRRRYASVRGYSKELLSLLTHHSDLDVTEVSYDVLGPNPLHPQTKIRWQAEEDRREVY